MPGNSRTTGTSYAIVQAGFERVYFTKPLDALAAPERARRRCRLVEEARNALASWPLSESNLEFRGGRSIMSGGWGRRFLARRPFELEPALAPRYVIVGRLEKQSSPGGKP